VINVINHIIAFFRVINNVEQIILFIRWGLFGLKQNNRTSFSASCKNILFVKSTFSAQNTKEKAQEAFCGSV
jgi:hypothetical protein